MNHKNGVGLLVVADTAFEHARFRKFGQTRCNDRHCGTGTERHWVTGCVHSNPSILMHMHLDSNLWVSAARAQRSLTP